jgi:hypothetical protein
MINLENKNILLYSNEIPRSTSSLLEYIKLIELSGLNFIYLHNKRSTLVSSIGVNKILYQNNQLKDIINSNSFRLDFILIEPDSLNWCIKELVDVKIPIVYVKKTKAFDDYKNWDMVYSFSGTPTPVAKLLSSISDEDDKLSDLFIEDIKSNEKFSLSDLVTRVKRNSIISDILNPK